MDKILKMEDLKDRRKLSWEGIFYSIQRIDLLIVSISGAGIYVCLETMKYIRDNNLTDEIFIKVSGGLFLLAIGFNFVSQIYGRKSNYQDYLMCDTEIKAGKKISEKEQNEIDEHDRMSEKYSKLTNVLTDISTLLMFLGLVVTMLFFLFIF